MYYLQSRYYDSEVGRFISPDAPGYLGANADLTSYNLYAYCSNNPVMYTDPSGHAWYNVVYDWVNTVYGFLNPVSKVTAVVTVAVAMFQGRWSDLEDDWTMDVLIPLINLKVWL